MEQIVLDKGKSLKDMVYKSLLNDILTGMYPPDVVITEKELVEKYSISKSPIREALIELCNEKVVRSIPRYGYEVLRISEDEITEVKESRVILEVGALDRYFDKITSNDIDELYALLNRQSAEEMGIVEHWKKNSAFHMALMECYGNKTIVTMLESSLSLMARAYVQYQFKKYKQMKFHGKSRLHRDILEAIKNGNKQMALDLLTADIGAFETKI